MSSSVCRVCLSGNIRLLNIDKMHLHILDKLTGSKTNRESDVGMPSTVCYVCHRQLQRCHMFSEMAHRSHRTMQEMLDNDIEITCSTTSMLSPATMPTLSVNHTHRVFVIQHSKDTSFSATDNHEQLVMKTEAIAGTVFVESHDTSDEDAQYIASSNNKQLGLFNDAKGEQTNIKPGFTCDMCNRLFYSKYCLVKHLKFHTRKKVNSKQCDEAFSESNMQKHRGAIVKPSSCTICNKVFILEANLWRHMQLHTGQQKLYSCRVCSAPFTQEKRLISHMQAHAGEKPYSCNICNKKFGYKYSLSIHQRVHTGDKPYLCNTCNKTFIMKINLIKHMRSHTGEKPYSCTSCTKVFSDKSNLSRHIVRIHSEQMSYSCVTCKKAFNNNNTLKRHMQSHTEEKINLCCVCGKTFALRSSLARHIRVHSGDKSFSNESSLKHQSMQLHAADKPYSCTKCNMVFTYKVSLKLHMQLHNREKS